MAGSQPTFTTRSFEEIVNRLDPKRLTEPQVVYLFGSKVKKERPTLPGEEYQWVKDINQ